MKRTGQISGNTGQKIPSNEPPSWYKKLLEKKEMMIL